MISKFVLVVENSNGDANSNAGLQLGANERGNG